MSLKAGQQQCGVEDAHVQAFQERMIRDAPANDLSIWCIGFEILREEEP